MTDTFGDKLFSILAGIASVLAVVLGVVLFFFVPSLLFNGLQALVGDGIARVGPLKEQAQKAQRFLKLSDEKKELEIGIWVKSLSRAKEILLEQEHKLLSAHSQHEGAEKKLSDIEREIEEVQIESGPAASL